PRVAYSRTLGGERHPPRPTAKRLHKTGPRVVQPLQGCSAGGRPLSPRVRCATLGWDVQPLRRKDRERSSPPSRRLFAPPLFAAPPSENLSPRTRAAPGASPPRSWRMRLRERVDGAPAPSPNGGYRWVRWMSVNNGRHAARKNNSGDASPRSKRQRR